MLAYLIFPLEIFEAPKRKGNCFLAHHIFPLGVFKAHKKKNNLSSISTLEVFVHMAVSEVRLSKKNRPTKHADLDTTMTTHRSRHADLATTLQCWHTLHRSAYLDRPSLDRTSYSVIRTFLLSTWLQAGPVAAAVYTCQVRVGATPVDWVGGSVVGASGARLRGEAVKRRGGTGERNKTTGCPNGVPPRSLSLSSHCPLSLLRARDTSTGAPRARAAATD